MRVAIEEGDTTRWQTRENGTVAIFGLNSQNAYQNDQTVKVLECP